MELSRDKKRVIIRRTDRVHGCLMQGGVCGRVSTYPVDHVMRVTGLRSLAEIEAADLDDVAPESVWGHSIGDWIAEKLGDGKIVRRGVVIS